MKNSMKKLLSLTLALTVTVSMAPMMGGMAYAADESGSSKAIEELASQLQDRNRDPFDYLPGQGSAGMETKDAYPESYDLRKVDVNKDRTPDFNFVTPVKFQNPFGTCWGFAAIAAAESSILGNEALSGNYSTSLKQGEDGKTVLDLSEKHLANFVVRPIADENDPQYGEGKHYFNEKKSLQQKFNDGGLPIYATSLFSSGIGPNLESRDEGNFKYMGAEGSVQYNVIGGKSIKYCYSEDDDWSMDESLRFKQSYVLKESYMLPSPAKIIEENENGESLIDPKYEYNPAGTEAIKDQILQNRAVEIGFCADNSMPDQEGGAKYISENWAHYTYTPENANHAVTIVGWDDNYRKENFRHELNGMSEEEAYELTTPPEDGAWLVKNSWGSGEEVFPNRGGGNWGIVKTDENGTPVKDEAGNEIHTGYFWLSYYDQSLGLPEALAFDKSNVGGEYYLDQHDYMPVSDIVSGELTSEMKMANVFRADVCEKLEQISCQTSTPGTSVEYKVYLLTGSFSDPEEGVLVSSGNDGPYEYGGFHKIELADKPLIQKGQYYSIVITQKIGDDMYSFNMPMENGKEMAKYMDMDSWSEGIVNPRESFAFTDGKWRDFSDENLRDELFDKTWRMMSFDNFPIKGYCSKAENDVTMYPNTGDAIRLDLFGDKKKETVRMRFKGKGEPPAEPEFSWEILEGGEALFDIAHPKDKTETEDKSSATITAKKAGTGYIKVDCRDVGTVIIKVDVSSKGKYDPSDAELEYGDSTIICINDYNDEYVDPSTLKLTSKNENVFTIARDGTVKATGVGTATGTVSDEEGAEASFEVKVIKTANKLNVSGRTGIVKGSTKGKKGKLKKNKTLKVSKVIKFKNKGQGKKTYTKVSGNKKIKINKKTGKVTVKKGLKKGTYKVKVKVRAAGDKNHDPAVKKVTIKVKVK